MIKRGFDILLSTLGLIASLPLWGFIALAVRLHDGGPVFYRQLRVGKDGRVFTGLKFRSMTPDSERKWGVAPAVANDPRVTKVGKLLRATAMDELPQLWNILRGDMSFVGPRPEWVELVKRFRAEIPRFDLRHQVRPGLTGLAQVYGHSETSRRNKLRYDLLYARRQSFWLDIRLVLLSFAVTFTGRWELRESKISRSRQRRFARPAPQITMPLNEIPCARVLGVPVHVLGLHDVVRSMEGWIRSGEVGRWIAVTSSHGIMEGFKHREFRQVLESASLSVPDGKWTARAAAAHLSLEPRQVRGADLMWEFCALADHQGYSSYFLGDTAEVLERLTARLRGQFPGLRIAGAYSPPFRPLSKGENDEIIQRINDAKPHVLWVCLGLPKQECWIFANRQRLRVPIVIAAGAAAKFVSGSVAAAPAWIRKRGFEWLWRLIREPRRCWRRSMLYGPQFALFAALELSGVRKFES